MLRVVLLAAAILAAPMSASADQNAYCAGFAAGWKSAFETRNLMVQMTPMCPMPPMGKDNFQAGYEAGLLRALSQIVR